MAEESRRARGGASGIKRRTPAVRGRYLGAHAAQAAKIEINPERESSQCGYQLPVY